MGLLDAEVDPNAEMKHILHLEKLDVNLYRGVSPSAPRWGRMYGGQLIAQSLSAARATLPAFSRLHSTHCYFHRPGDDDTPALYYVEAIKDTFKFATRRVTAVQSGNVIFSAMASFTKHAQPQIIEEGPSYQQPLASHYPAWLSAATSSPHGYKHMVAALTDSATDSADIAAVALPVPTARAYLEPPSFPFAKTDIASAAPFGLPHPDTLPSLPTVMLALSKDDSPALSPRARRVLHRAAAQFTPFDIRWVDLQDRHAVNWGSNPDARLPVRCAYVRVRADLPPNELCAGVDAPVDGDNSWQHAVALSYLSDWGMVAALAKPLAMPPFSPRVQPASLDHALHVHHADFDAREWLLFTVHCPVYAHQRGMLVGQFWDLRGRLVASVHQEALVKIRPEKSKNSAASTAASGYAGPVPPPEAVDAAAKTRAPQAPLAASPTAASAVQRVAAAPEAVAAARLARVQRQLIDTPAAQNTSFPGRSRSRPRSADTLTQNAPILLATQGTVGPAPMMPENDPSLPPATLSVPPNLTTTANLSRETPPATLKNAYVPDFVRGRGHFSKQKVSGSSTSARSEEQKKPLSMDPTGDIPVAVI